MLRLAKPARISNRRPPGTLPKDKSLFFYSCFSAALLADQYGLTKPYLVTLNFGPGEKPSNAWKPFRADLVSHLGNRPWLSVGVRIIGNSHVQDHEHAIIFADDRAQSVIELASERRCSLKARSMEVEPVYDLPGAVFYLAGQENLERAGAQVYRSQVVLSEVATGIFGGLPTLAEYRCLPWPLWVPQEERRRWTSVSFPRQPLPANSEESAIAMVAGQPPAKGRDATSERRNEGVRQMAGAVTNATLSRPETATGADAVIVAVDLFGATVIELSAVTAYTGGTAPAPVRTAVKRAMAARFVTSDSLAAFIGVTQPHLENTLSGHDGLSSGPASKLMGWLASGEPIPTKRRARPAKRGARNNDLPALFAA